MASSHRCCRGLLGGPCSWAAWAQAGRHPQRRCRPQPVTQVQRQAPPRWQPLHTLALLEPADGGPSLAPAQSKGADHVFGVVDVGFGDPAVGPGNVTQQEEQRAPAPARQPVPRDQPNGLVLVTRQLFQQAGKPALQPGGHLGVGGRGHGVSHRAAPTGAGPMPATVPACRHRSRRRRGSSPGPDAGPWPGAAPGRACQCGRRGRRTGGGAAG